MTRLVFNLMQKLSILLALLFVANESKLFAVDTYTFGVLPQRSALLNATAWNPILEYISSKTGKKLLLKVTRSGDESRSMVISGSYDFVFSNHMFDPLARKAQYRVILRPNTEDITGQIVVMENSQIASVKELQSLPVGFPSRAAFVGYTVPMEYLTSQKITITPVFGGNQEGIMAQLKSGQVKAAAVNSVSMKAYAKKEKLSYLVLWESQKYHAFPICVSPRVSKSDAQIIQTAFVQMSKDPVGAKILAESAKISNELSNGFVLANDGDYANYINFFSPQK